MHQVFQPLVLVFLRIVRLVVPGAQPEEPGGNHRIERAVGQLITGELFEDEAVVREVAVECPHDPVAVFPRERLGLIAFVPARFGEADQVQPMPRPAFAKLRRGEQPVDQSLVGPRVGIGDKPFDLGAGGREPDQVVHDASQQRLATGGGGGREPGRFEPGGNESIDRVVVGTGGDRVGPQWLQRPEIAPGPHIVGGFEQVERATGRPVRPLCDPLPQHLLFGLGEGPRLPLPGGRHFAGCHAGQQGAVGRFPGDPRGTGVAPLQPTVGRNQHQAAIGVAGVVTLEAALHQDRGDLGLEVNRRRGQRDAGGA